MPAVFTTMTPGDPASEAVARLLHGATLSDAVRLTPEEEERCQLGFTSALCSSRSQIREPQVLAGGQPLRRPVGEQEERQEDLHGTVVRPFRPGDTGTVQQRRQLQPPGCPGRV
ncbi:hypothetical protein OG226_00405 [Streptomyces sp. NBC_01261]|uniref:hypothetical protein n=1 Tax=Streptomyces sp. NBC_01261 TaxID=2903802 RepID=UPI002E37E96C|nr:hypothetical protein [Streptomyces sp. NBC_01261]